MIRPATLMKWVFMPLLLSLAAWGTASAETLGISGYYNNEIVMANTPLKVTDFMSTVAGTVTLSVTDKYAETQWGDLLSTLSTSITLFSGQKLLFEGNATTVFDIGANERFTTSIYALTTGAKGFGLYNLDIAFRPAAVVPLPLGAWLLLGGSGLLATRIRRIRPAALPLAG